MAGNSTLVVHCGGVRRTHDELTGLATPAATATWHPVPHHELVAALVGGLATAGVAVTRQQYCTMGRDDARLLGTLDLIVPDLDTPDFSMALGLRASNDKSSAIRLIAAARVFVCDNMAFSGSGGAVFLNKKHTSGLRIDREVPRAVDIFLEKAGQFRQDIDQMKVMELSDGRAKQIAYDAFAGGLLPSRLLDDVHHLYFDDHDQRDKFAERTLWSLNQAFTEAVKVLRPAPQQAAGVAIGRLFGRVCHRMNRVVAPGPAPLATIDGVDVFGPRTIDIEMVD